MIIDHRTYTVAHGCKSDFLSKFEKFGLPVQMRHLGNMIGYFTTVVGSVNDLVHMWGYEDFADMEGRRSARNADPGWGEFRRMTKGMLVKQETKILKPTSFSTLR
jgi:hypothetical protein